MRVVAHHPTEALRQLIRREKRAKRVRRLQAIGGAIGGESSPERAPRLQLSERSIRMWVSRYNGEGRAGREDQPGRGRKPTRSPDQERRRQERVRAGATAADGVCTLRGEEVRRLLTEEFGVVLKRQAVDNLRHKLGFSLLRPRPQHPDADPAAPAAFPKTDRVSAPQSPPTIRTSRSKSGSRTRPASARKER